MFFLGYRVGNLASPQYIEHVKTHKIYIPLCVLMEGFVGFPCPLPQINLGQLLRGAITSTVGTHREI